MIVDKENQVFSILIPTWNNLAYLKFCVESIKKNSRFEHQIIVHVNEGSDGTSAWLESEGIEYTYSHENVGICWALNKASRLAKTDFILYMNDDMYALPDWDLELVNEIERQENDMFFLSSTMIEPTGGQNPCVIWDPRFGDSLETFNEDLLLQEFQGIEKDDWNGATWPPNVVSKRLWDIVGGYSIEFSPGMGSDPDFSMKLWKYGVRVFKGVSASRVYHFQCKSTGRIKKNDGKTQFLRKWGVTVANFWQEYLRNGTAFNGPLFEPTTPLKLTIKDKYRRGFND